MKTCPFCAEEIRDAAVVCKHCGRDLQQGSSPPPPPPAPPSAAAQKTNSLAIAALVLGIAWIGFIGSILAIIFGLVARKQIDESGGAQTGRGMATAGLWLGVAGIVLPLGLIAAFTVASDSVTTPVVVEGPIFDSFEDTGEAPALGDHWHVAYGIYICDSFVPPLTDRPDVAIHNLHSHADGLIHIHPLSSAATGENATLGVFAETVGMHLDSDSIDLPGDLPDVAEGEDRCDGEDAVVRLAVWEPTQFNTLGQATAWGDEPELILTDPAEFRPQDDQLVTIAFAPQDADLPRPPSIDVLAAPADEPAPPG